MCVGLSACVSLFNLKASGFPQHQRKDKATTLRDSHSLSVSLSIFLYLSHISLSCLCSLSLSSPLPFSVIPGTGVEKLSHCCIIILLCLCESFFRFGLQVNSNLATLAVPRPHGKEQISICQKLQYGDRECLIIPTLTNFFVHRC